jgi:hypothetical protein
LKLNPFMSRLFRFLEKPHPAKGGVHSVFLDFSTHPF